METAQAQAGLNRDTAITQYQLGATNQITPFGSLTYDQIGTWGGGSPTGQSAPRTPAVTSTRKEPIYQTNSQGKRQIVGYKDVPGTSSPTAFAQTGGGAGPVTPRFQVTQTLSPEMQKITDQLMSGAGNLTGQIAGSTKTPLSFGGLPQYASGLDMKGAPGLVGGIQGAPGMVDRLDLSGLPGMPGAGDFSADRQRIEGSLMERLNPQLSQEREALEARLASQGLVYGNDAYGGAMDDYGRMANDARLAVIGQAGDEQQRLFNMGMGARQQGFAETLGSGQFANQAQQQMFGQNAAQAAFTNQARQQASNEALMNANLQNAARTGGIQDILTQRNQPINELAALLSSTQMQQPNYVNTPQPGVGGVDYTGLVNQKYQGELQSAQAGMGGLFGLGSALIGALPFSDERLKTDIERVGETDEGTPIFTYRMKAGGPMQMGIMAQDIEGENPEAVFMHPSGFRMVDYGKVH